MKIRSSLTERTLYRQRTDKSTARSNGRRLTTLTLALVLVLLLMQQAGDPEVYRKIFARLGVPITTPAGIEIPSQPDFLPVAAAKTAAAADFTKLIAQLNDEDRDRLTRRLAAIRHRDPAAMAEPDEQQTALAATVASAARESGFADPTRFDAALLDADATEPELEQLRLGLQSALDATYFDTIEDGTVWNQGDFKAFYRSLERIADEDRLSDDPVYVGVVPLIEQSVSYRGRHVRMYGQAVQASRIDAKPNPFQIEDYWMVWLRPIDGSERPIVVYSPSVPPQIAALKGTGVDESGPMVDIDGIFLKRYLYRSVGGYEQAPLLVARIEPASQAAAASSEPPPRSGIAIAFAAAAMIAAAATGLWYWSFRRSQRRDHLLRQKRTQPDLKLFDELD
ncbi:hypothetical protein CA51_09290 [Rosistilla oblonga]|uniref:Uncharacterized protein n=1 Tax=Rosistilla oblonga TaxID=2527990 RepID=A0A518IPJ5_9BACT|nr:hypothetical protein [Rosistilla oblonga]QDV11069.1 hypothetical protein CA51_09290 [Rosistilla oblonga]QDV54990.1 hypothetical protein Mal33_09580 [Rosistilla oblonga]